MVRWCKNSLYGHNSHFNVEWEILRMQDDFFPGKMVPSIMLPQCWLTYYERRCVFCQLEHFWLFLHSLWSRHISACFVLLFCEIMLLFLHCMLQWFAAEMGKAQYICTFTVQGEKPPPLRLFAALLPLLFRLWQTSLSGCCSSSVTERLWDIFNIKNSLLLYLIASQVTCVYCVLFKGLFMDTESEFFHIKSCLTDFSTCIHVFVLFWLIKDEISLILQVFNWI